MNLVPKNFRIFKLIIREDCSRILRKNLEAGGVRLLWQVR